MTSFIYKLDVFSKAKSEENTRHDTLSHTLQGSVPFGEERERSNENMGIENFRDVSFEKGVKNCLRLSAPAPL